MNTIKSVFFVFLILTVSCNKLQFKINNKDAFQAVSGFLDNVISNIFRGALTVVGVPVSIGVEQMQDITNGKTRDPWGRVFSFILHIPVFPVGLVVAIIKKLKEMIVSTTLRTKHILIDMYPNTWQSKLEQVKLNVNHDFQGLIRDLESLKDRSKKAFHIFDE